MSFDDDLMTVRPEVEKVEAAQQRRDFLARFPREAWSTMTLKWYALGVDGARERYCYWLEWGTSELGSVRGGSAKKHVVYRRTDGTWYHPPQFATPEDALAALRTGYTAAFALAAAGR